MTSARRITDERPRRYATGLRRRSPGAGKHPRYTAPLVRRLAEAGDRERRGGCQCHDAGYGGQRRISPCAHRAVEGFRRTGFSLLYQLPESERQRAEIEEELLAARRDAIYACANMGAFKGTLETNDFTLPNPGGGQPLLEDASCTLVRGRRYGLIGRNGTGKSTMLRALASRRHGNFPPNLTVHYVSQEVNLSAEQRQKNPVEIVVDADLERTMLMEETEELEALSNSDQLDVEGATRLGECLARLVDIGAETASARATQLLDNLGFTSELKARPLENLSGGWRVRTMLAAAIFAEPDLLLLDEPTNHLSILAVMWLARELSHSPTWKSRIVTIVSHDRHFMDVVCTDVLHISGAARRLTQSRGNYTSWNETRRQQQIAFAKEAALRQAEIDKLQDYAGHGFKYGGSSSQINKMKMKEKNIQTIEQGN